MGNRSDPPQGEELDRIDQEAADWVSRMDRGLTDSEEAAFLEWLEQNPHHVGQLKELQRSWSICDRLMKSPQLAEASGPCAGENGDIAKRNFLIRYSWAFAAVFLISFISFWILGALSPERMNSVFLAEGAYALRYERNILQDGSVVELNVGAQVEVFFSEELRWLRLLEGEAHFIVTKNPDRPFVVNVEGMDIRAVGTAFSVKLDNSLVEVLVTEGRVNVVREKPVALMTDPIRSEMSESDSIQEDLIAGQKSVFLAGTGFNGSVYEIVEPSVDEITKQLSWRDEILEFSSSPLNEVVEEFNRRNYVKIVIIDKELTRLKINAALNPSNLDGFIELLELSAGVRTEVAESGTILLYHQ